MTEPSSPPVESLPKTALKEAIPLVEIEGQVAQAYELCRYWVDDDNLVYSATLNMTADAKQIILFRENVSGVESEAKRNRLSLATDSEPLIFLTKWKLSTFSVPSTDRRR